MEVITKFHVRKVNNTKILAGIIRETFNLFIDELLRGKIAYLTVASFILRV